MRRLLPIIFLLCSAQFFAQESQDSILWEMEDSISAMTIKLLKPSQTRKLLKQVIKRFQQDLQQEYKTGRYQITATFNRDTLAPLSVSRTVSAKAGIALPYHDVRSNDFKYEGTYKLNHRDSVYIADYLNVFPSLSPNHVPWVLHLYYSYHGHIDKDALLPFENYSETVFYYNVTAYSIIDAAGRGAYRFIFTRNGVKRFGRDVVFGKKYDVGELTGTAYFDSRTLRITQFKGKARVPTEMHTIHYRIQNDYEEDNELPVLRQTKLVWEVKGTTIRVIIQKIEE